MRGSILLGCLLALFACSHQPPATTPAESTVAGASGARTGAAARVEPAGAAEAISLLGRTLVPPALPAAVQAEREAKLVASQAALAERPDDPEAWIWVGRRIAYLGRYRDAIDHFTQGLELFPRDARFLRHRGHRFLTIRRLSDATSDLERAASLVRGQPDEVEPDGLPNAANVPTSTLQSNIWYHLGLARYLQGDFEAALGAYRECLTVSKNPDMANPDMEIATRYWLYLTLRRLGREGEAREVAAAVPAELELLESHAYHRLLLMFRGENDPETLLAEASADRSSLDYPTVSYGAGVHYLLAGEVERGLEIFRRLAESDAWAAFGAIAAEAELERRLHS